MNETTEQLLIWGSIGVGTGLLASRHRRVGMLVASVAPTVAVLAHPKGTRRVLRGIPIAFGVSGKAIGTSGKVSGKTLWKSAKGVGKGFAVAGRTVVKAVS